MEWLSRSVAPAAPHLTLCLSADEFLAAVSELGVTTNCGWVSSEDSIATTHYFRDREHQLVAIVCMCDYQQRSPVAVAGTLVHEAVHVWQSYCEEIGERQPGREQEAYAIEFIASALMNEFSRRMNDTQETST